MNEHSGKNGAGGSKRSRQEEHTAALARLAEADRGRGSLHVGARLRNYFLTGLIIVGPVSITLYIVWWFINVIDAWVKPLVPDIYNPDTYLPFSLPGVGLIFATFILMVIGALAANLFGRTLISYSEMMLGRMPVVRNVYRALKQIFETVLSQSSTSFQKVGIIEWPREGLYAIVFISTETKGEIAHKWEGETELLSVFLPTTPNPTSGYLLFVPRGDIIELDMSVEDAAKMVISAGLVTPAHQEELARLAEQSRKNDHEPEKPPASDIAAADGQTVTAEHKSRATPEYTEQAAQPARKRRTASSQSNR
ncbi:MAG: DUF502 domain-containing protein [Hyphomicrobiaceae bacterium]